MTIIHGHARRRSLERLSYGLYVSRAGRCLVEDVKAWSLVLPNTASFTHLTAAELMGWWLPSPIQHPVFAAMPVGEVAPARSGLLVCRHPKPVASTIIGGLRVTTPAETLLAAARDLGVLDLVIMGDSALRQGCCTVAELRATAARHRRGAPMLRQVIGLLDPLSESAWESVMRVLHRAAEVDVKPQHKIYDGQGRFVARGDLWVVGTRRLHEYDGAGHREAEVHRKDLSRERAIVLSDWQRIGYTSREILRGGAGIIASVDALLGRSWDPRRLAAWKQLVRNSLYGDAGRARARQHWSRVALPSRSKK